MSLVGSRPMTSLSLRSTVCSMTDLDLAAINAQRDRIRTRYLRPPTERPGSAARGVHHLALLCADVERTIRFYQEVLEFPLTEIFENRSHGSRRSQSAGTRGPPGRSGWCARHLH